MGEDEQNTHSFLDDYDKTLSLSLSPTRSDSEELDTSNQAPNSEGQEGNPDICPIM